MVKAAKRPDSGEGGKGAPVSATFSQEHRYMRFNDAYFGGSKEQTRSEQENWQDFVLIRERRCLQSIKLSHITFSKLGTKGCRKQLCSVDVRRGIHCRAVEGDEEEWKEDTPLHSRRDSSYRYIPRPSLLNRSEKTRSRFEN